VPLSRRRRLEILLLLGALAAMGAAAIDMYVPALPAIATDLGVSTASTQLTVTTFLVGLGVGQVVSGPFTDVFGRRRPLLVGVALYVAAGAACAGAQSVAFLAGARFVQGLAAAAGVVVSRAVVRDLYSGAELARSYSRLFVVVALVPIAAPVIGTQILSVTSWRGIFAFLVAFGVVVLAVCAVRLPETLPPERRTPAGFAFAARSFRGVMRHRGLLGYSLTLSCATGALVATIAAAPFVVQDFYGESAQVYGVLILFGGVAVLVTTQLNSALLRRLSPRRLLFAGLLAAAAAGIVLVAAGDAALWVFVACFVGLFGTYGFVLPNSTALALREQAAVAGSAAAFLGLVQYGTGALAAPLAGAAGGDGAFALGVVVTGFAAAGCAIGLLTIAWERRRARA
jgi:DHA1 family bicyclomycin/chloramphenicol resistance-like MFS transporter